MSIRGLARPANGTWRPGHALVVAAGGAVTNSQGAPLVYGRMAENFRVPAFIAWGDPDKGKMTKPVVTCQRAMVRATSGHLRVARSMMRPGSARKAVRASAL